MKQINFMLEEEQKAIGLQSGLALKSVMMVLIGGLVIVAWNHLARQQIALADRELGIVNQQVQIALAKAQNVSVGTTKQLGQSKQMELYDKLKQPLPTSSVLAAVAGLMPPSMGLTSLSIVGEPVRVTPKSTTKSNRPQKHTPKDSQPPIRMLLEGLAPNDLTVAQFIGRLDDRVIFENVEMAYSQPTKRGQLLGREFRVTAEIPLNRTFVIHGQKKVSRED